MFEFKFKHLPALTLNLRPLPNVFSLTKLAAGLTLASFFLTYQPTLILPPHHNIAYAQQNLQQITPLASPFTFILPHPGYLSTHFSAFHPGIDIASGLGMPIHPVAKGIVADEGYNFWGLGLTITIDHDQGFKSTYAHLGKIYVKRGQKVTSADFIGEVGLTGHTSGPHTHLEIQKDGKNIDPLTILPPIADLPIDNLSSKQTASN